MAGTYACPACERLACYGGDPYPCSWCGFDGRATKREETE